MLEWRLKRISTLSDGRLLLLGVAVTEGSDLAPRAEEFISTRPVVVETASLWKLPLYVVPRPAVPQLNESTHHLIHNPPSSSSWKFAMNYCCGQGTIQYPQFIR